MAPGLTSVVEEGCKIISSSTVSWDVAVDEAIDMMAYLFCMFLICWPRYLDWKMAK
jgi:hypothetical protein